MLERFEGRLLFGRTRHVRKFGQPRTADPQERVWVVCAMVPGPAVVTVNGEPVTQPGRKLRAGDRFGMAGEGEWTITG